MSLARRSVLQRATGCLERHGVPEPQADAEVLLAYVLMLPRLQIHIDALEPVTLWQQRAYQDCLRRRIQGEPVQYITGAQEFHSLPFEVNPHVLIPRPESELLVDQGVRWAEHWATQNAASHIHCLDVGTGSGNLGISLLQELPNCSVCAVDSSFAALNVARRNACRLGVSDPLARALRGPCRIVKFPGIMFCRLRCQLAVRHERGVAAIARAHQGPRAGRCVTGRQ